MMALLVLLLAGTISGTPIATGIKPEDCETGYPRNPDQTNCYLPLGRPVTIVAHGDVDEGCKFLHTSNNRTCCYMDKVRNFQEDPELCDRARQPAGCRGEGDFIVNEKRRGLNHGTCTLEISSLKTEDLGMYKVFFPGDQKTNKIINTKKINNTITISVVSVLLVLVLLLATTSLLWKKIKSRIEKIPCLKRSLDKVGDTCA